MRRRLLILGLLLLAVFLSGKLWRFSRDVQKVARLKGFDCWAVDPVYLRRFAPNCSGVNRSMDGSSLPFRTNSRGLFEREIRPEDRRAGRLRVLLLGDSDLVTFHPGPTIFDRLRERLGAENLEIINGSFPGGTLVQLRLFQRELLREYRPDLVLLYFNFNSSALATVYHHLIGERAGADGLVEHMGYFNFLWPVPDRIAARFFGVHELRQVATTLRSWQERRILAWGPDRARWFMPAKRGGASLLDININYIQSMEREAGSGGAEFFLISGASRCRAPKRAGAPDYKSEFMAIREGGVPGKRYREQCVRSFSELRTSEPWRTLAGGWIGRHGAGLALIEDDVHTNPFGTMLMTDHLEKGVRRALQKFDARHPGKRKRHPGLSGKLDLRS